MTNQVSSMLNEKAMQEKSGVKNLLDSNLNGRISDKRLPEDRLVVQTLTGLKCIHIPDIIYITKEKQKGHDRFLIYLEQDECVALYGNCFVKQFSSQLHGFNFFQIDRNTLINLNYLDEIETKSRICKLLKNNRLVELCISRSKLKEFKERFCMLK